MKTVILTGAMGVVLALTACGPNTQTVCAVNDVVVDDSQCRGNNHPGVSVEVDVDKMKVPPQKGQKIQPGAPVKTLPKYTPPPKVAPKPPAPPTPLPAPKPPKTHSSKPGK